VVLGALLSPLLAAAVACDDAPAVVLGKVSTARTGADIDAAAQSEHDEDDEHRDSSRQARESDHDTGYELSRSEPAPDAALPLPTDEAALDAGPSTTPGQSTTAGAKDAGRPDPDDALRDAATPPTSAQPTGGSGADGGRPLEDHHPPEGEHHGEHGE